MAKKTDEYPVPDYFGSDWHTYMPKQRAYIKHEGDKVLVYVVGGSSVSVMDEAEFLADWQECSEARPAHNVA